MSLLRELVSKLFNNNNNDNDNNVSLHFIITTGADPVQKLTGFLTQHETTGSPIWIKVKGENKIGKKSILLLFFYSRSR
jgi:hypothetical protein